MTNDKCRAAFEEWCKTQGLTSLKTNSDGEYLCDYNHIRWQAYQAAWNTHKKPQNQCVTDERAQDRQALDILDRMEEMVLEFAVRLHRGAYVPQLKEDFQTLRANLTAPEPADTPSDGVRDALDIFLNAVDMDGWVYPEGKCARKDGFSIMTPEQHKRICTALSQPDNEVIREVVEFLDKIIHDYVDLEDAYYDIKHFQEKLKELEGRDE